MTLFIHHWDNVDNIFINKCVCVCVFILLNSEYNRVCFFSVCMVDTHGRKHQEETCLYGP